MERLSVPRIIISGNTRRVGKSLLVLGIVTELKQRGISVSCCVVGPNFKQASLLRGISDRYVHVLDPEIQNQGQLLESIFMAGLGADIIIIEGQGTLLESTSDLEFVGGPDTFLAKLTYTPICPVFDASNKEDESLDHLEKNISMISGVQICAAIANRLPNEQNQLLQAIARINNSLLVKGRPPLLGVVPAIVNPEELPSHGLDQKRKTLPISRQFLMELSSVVARCVDIDELLANASKAPSVMLDGYDYKPVSRRCRIAVSMDNAFGLLFQDNLSYLRFYGADIVPFSPLADVGLPKGVGGIYLTGGFLTEYSDDLMKNASMIRTIRAFQDEGGAIYAEGSSCAYLCKEFRNTDGRTFSAGLGIIPATAEKGDAELRYFRGSLMEESILGSGDLAIHGITNGDWAIKNPERMIRCLRMTREGVGTMLEGFSPSGQVFGTFSFLHWGTNPLVAKNMVEASSVIQFRYS